GGGPGLLRRATAPLRGGRRRRRGVSPGVTGEAHQGPVAALDRGMGRVAARYRVGTPPASAAPRARALAGGQRRIDAAATTSRGGPRAAAGATPPSGDPRP